MEPDYVRASAVFGGAQGRMPRRDVRVRFSQLEAVMVSSHEVSAALDVPALPSVIELHGVSNAQRPRPQTLAFMTSWSEAEANVVATNPGTLFLVPLEAPQAPNAIRVARPRHAYARVLHDVLTISKTVTIAETAYIDAEATLGTGVTIGHFAVIESGAVIGDGAHIGHHCVIESGVEIGARTIVGNLTNIGGQGFGIESDDDGTPVRIDHRGGVVIGRDVEIGNHCSIARGTIEPTRIADHVKVDDHVFIAHNAQIGEGALIIAGAEISGSVVIGKRAWIGPETAIIQKVTIGDDAMTGIGAVVVRDVPPNMIVAGVPARPTRERHPTTLSPSESD
jgi:UDP-3-O-[3-hydroxymyristoyl] glucosamine N-acyltransferase